MSLLTPPNLLNSRNIQYYGSGDLVYSDIGVLSTDRTGLETCTAVIMIRKDKHQNLPRINSPHPLWGHIAMEKRQLAIDGAWAIATCEYAGATFDAGMGDETPPVYERITGVAEARIETHPEFKSFAGTPQAPENGSIWQKDSGSRTEYYSAAAGEVAPTDPTGYSFYKFGAKSVYHGEDSYLDSSILTWRMTVNSRLPKADEDNSGKIDTPKGPYPKLKKPRNWLNMGTSETQRGSVFQHVTEWRASGKNGWREEWYEEAT